MFSRILTITRKEFLHVLRDRRSLVVMFAAPFMQLLLLGYAATVDVRNIPLAIYDQDRSPESRRLVEAFVASGQFAAERRVSSERDLSRLIAGGQVRAGLVIPPGYGADLLGGRRARVAFVLDGSDPTVATTALSSAQLIGQARATDVLQAALARGGAVGRLEPPLAVDTRVWYNPDMTSAIFMVPGLIGLVLQFQATLLTSSAIVRERERGTMEQLIVTPVRPFELIAGKIIPYAVLELIISAEVLVLGTLWFAVPIRGSIALLLAIACLFLTSTLATGLLVSTVARTQFEAFQLSFLTLLPAVFLSGFIYPIASMPAALQALSGLIPLTYFLVVVRGIVIKGVGLQLLVPQVIALTAFGAAMIALTSTRFRKRLD
jgi:ABC-2 type transport system permease protein